MNPRLAIIDIGTNSILMLITEINASGDLVCLSQFSETTRLGLNLHQTGRIDETNLLNTLQVLQQYQKSAETFQVQRIIAVGTQVFRLAQNRNDILKNIQNETGLSVEVLTENQEAEFSYRGAISGKMISNALVVDIGGGSTEMIYGGKEHIENMISIPIGAVIGTDQFLMRDPPEREACTALKEHMIKQTPQIWKDQLHQAPRLIFVGGTATTLAAVHLQLETYDANQVDGYKLTVSDIQNLLDHLCSCHLKERQRRLTLDPKRADIIIAGTLILQAILDIAEVRDMIISDRGLRHGIALREYGLFRNKKE